MLLYCCFRYCGEGRKLEEAVGTTEIQSVLSKDQRDAEIAGPNVGKGQKGRRKNGEGREATHSPRIGGGG